MLGLEQTLFDEFCRDLERRALFRAGRRPGFHAAAQRTEQIHLLVPDGREIDMHHMQVQSDQHDGSLCPCPAESVVQSLLAAHRIVDNIVSAEQHAVAKGALVELRACGPLYAHIAILRVDDMCRAQAGGLLYLEGMARQNADLRLRSQGAYSLQRKESDRASANNQDALAGAWEVAQYGVDRDRSRFKQYRLFVAHVGRYAKELLLGEQHLLAPAAPEHMRWWQIAALAEIEVAQGAGAAGRLHPRGKAIWTILERHTIAHVKELDIGTHLKDLAYDLVTRIGAALLLNGCGRDAQIAIGLDHVQIVAADARQAIAHAHPGGRGQR